MAEETAARGPLPTVPYLKIPEGRDPHLEGQQCGNCGIHILEKA